MIIYRTLTKIQHIGYLFRIFFFITAQRIHRTPLYRKDSKYPLFCLTQVIGNNLLFCFISKRGSYHRYNYSLLVFVVSA